MNCGGSPRGNAADARMAVTLSSERNRNLKKGILN